METKNEDKPHAKRAGWLKNNNPSGDFTKSKRCQARTRSKGYCQAPAMKNGRCRMHGGKSTGPRTLEGKEKIKAAHFKHGEYTKQAQEEKRQIRSFIKSLDETLAEINDSASMSFTIK